MAGQRICCFCERWESGGIESFLNNMLLHMDISHMEVDIVAAQVCESVFTAGLEAKGIRFVPLSGRLRSPDNARLFRQLVRQRQYDVIHFNLFQGLSLHYVHIARQEGVGVRIAHGHGMGLRRSKTKALKLLLHRFGRACWSGDATHLWACSDPAARFLFSKRALEQTSVTMIPNAIETRRFRFSPEIRAAVRAQLGLDEQLLLGSVGRLSGEKNQTFLLDVFSELVKLHPDSRLLLVGEGDERAALESKAARLGIADKVIFYGVTRTVEQLYCAMDVFLFPSLMEGLGIAAVEAQACGLPTLCSDRVPSEARLTDLARALPLESGAQAWATAALSMCAADADRTCAADAVKAAGFDVHEVACKLQTAYLGA